MDTAKNNILNRLKSINNFSEQLPYPSVTEGEDIYPAPTDELAILFAEAFKKNGGKFIYCESIKELISNLQVLSQQKKWSNVYCWNKDLQELFTQHQYPHCSEQENLIHADASITTCEALVARTGSIVLTSNSASGRRLSIVPPVHIVIASSNQLVYNLKEILGLQTAREDQWPSMLCFTSTNSRTADIEKTLVNGAHGPKELFVFMLDI